MNRSGGGKSAAFGGVFAAVIGAASCAVAVGALGGCGDDDAGVPRCTPGAAAACTCPSGAAGAQTCGADGTFGPCACETDAGAEDAGRDDAGRPPRDAGGDGGDVLPDGGMPGTDAGGVDAGVTWMTYDAGLTGCPAVPRPPTPQAGSCANDTLSCLAACTTLSCADRCLRADPDPARCESCLDLVDAQCAVANGCETLWATLDCCRAQRCEPATGPLSDDECLASEVCGLPSIFFEDCAYEATGDACTRLDFSACGR
jgi:hypothetical protein